MGLKRGWLGMDELLKSVVADVNACSVLESLICGKGLPKPPKQRTRRGGRGLRPTNAGATGGDFEFDAHATVRKAVKRCREVRAIRQGPDKEPIDDETLSKYARFTDDTALQPFAPFLHYVPRLVNVVTVRVSLTGSSLYNSNALLVSRVKRSWQRPFPCPAPGSSCHSTSTLSPVAARAPTLPPSASVLCN